MSTTTTPRGESDKRIGAYFAPLSVSAQDIPNMAVRVRAGSFFNSQNAFTEYAGGNTPAISTPVSNARWTVIALTDAGNIALIHGAASTAPSLPDVPSGHMPLAGVYITSTTPAITESLIIDLRPVIRSIDIVPNLDTALADRPTVTDLDNALLLKADTTGTPEAEFVLNADFTTGNPGTDAAVVVKRGNAADVRIRWNESVDVWELTTDGITYAPIATTAGVFAPVSHTHLSADVTDLAAGIDTRISLAGINALADVTISIPSSGQVMTYNGSVWVNQVPVLPSHVHTKSSVSDFTEADYVHTTGVETVGGNKTFSGNVAVSGNLTVGGAGTTVTLAADAVNIKDKVIELNYGEVGAGVGGGTPQDAGILVDRGSLPDAVLQWNENTDTWQVGVVGSMDTIVTDVNIASLATTSSVTSHTSDTAIHFALPISQSDVTGLTSALSGKASVANPIFTGVAQLPLHLVGALPTGVVGGIIFVTDATPAPSAAVYNGADWVDLITGVAVV